ncbi:hypothetical protein PYW08_006871 [Mythimna loreyi]|uniref:Uncharacterized protein n=1 Tax=Mythimna loreyi TaxID=667449 RepID=A0ACC2R844_9NEOP|nr:hypothetical protein PYW08_006871 [Mythimna loreyi]
MNKPALNSVLYAGGALICGIIIKVLEISIFRNKNKQSDVTVNEVLFYGAEDEEETQQIRTNNMLCIHYVILHARSTVDVCVPSLASDSLAKCLVSVQQKNKVYIRVAIHNSNDFHNLQLLAQNGIEVKVIKTGVRLAHEFVLLDARAGEPLALAGALPGAGPARARAATLLTSDSTLITALGLEFERVWNSVPDITCARDDKRD